MELNRLELSDSCRRFASGKMRCMRTRGTGSDAVSATKLLVKTKNKCRLNNHDLTNWVYGIANVDNATDLFPRSRLNAT